MKFAKKSLGQNFLIDRNIIKKITNLTNIKNCNIVEIGPGHGALTTEILKLEPKSFHIIEKDFELFSKLKFRFLNMKVSESKYLKDIFLNSIAELLLSCLTKFSENSVSPSFTKSKYFSI